MKLSKELELVEATIRRAAEYLRGIAGGPLKVLSTEGKDIKLQADVESEKLIIRELKQGRSYPILGEESGEHGERFDGRFWVIDPLDGTLNFSRGIPIYCISIALMEGERALIGAIYDFTRDELFTAVTGEGAWLNGQPMRVSSVTEAAGAVLSTGFPSYGDFSDEALSAFVHRVQVFKKQRYIGSAALSLAWVACGRFDAYAEDDVMLWDVAAGLALVEGAGGHVRLRPSDRSKWARRIRCASHPAIWSADIQDR